MIIDVFKRQIEFGNIRCASQYRQFLLHSISIELKWICAVLDGDDDDDDAVVAYKGRNVVT